MTLYNEDGRVSTTEVDGLTYAGLYSADGNYNIVINDGSALQGLYHPCGALNAVIGTAETFYHANGSANVNEIGVGEYVLAVPL